METRDIAMVILATTLIDSELLYPNGKPIPKRKLNKTAYSLEDEELVKLFIFLDRPLKVKVSNRILEIINSLLNSLPEGENRGNLLLVALDLLIMSQPISSLLYMKATRLQAVVINNVADKSLITKSFRIADNLHRMVTGRPMLDNSLRNMQKLAKLAKKLKEK